MAATREKSGEQGCESVVGCTLRDGEYLVRHELGCGGVRKVYFAMHTTLAIPLAIKQTRADKPLPESVITELDHILLGRNTTSRLINGAEEMFPSSGGVHTDRFLREALLLARLLHPAIPTLYDYFFEDGYWYLVMDYVPGPTLTTYLRKHAPLPAMEALNYAMQLCDVLDYLHSQLPPIIFRDLKPSNIILTPEGTLMIVGFGSARYLERESGLRSGIVNGAPALPCDPELDGGPAINVGYASPEQDQCPEQMDGRSDLYSLGVILHEMLSGQSPELSGGVFEALQHVDPAISSVLSGLVTFATRTDSAQSFQSAHTFYLALERAYVIEEQRAYLQQLLRQTEKIPIGDMEESVVTSLTSEQSAAVEAEQCGEIVQEDTEPEIPAGLPAPSLDLDVRRQTRAALQRARQEQLEQQNLEIQLASVDESLKRRSFTALSQPARYRLLEPAKTGTTGQFTRKLHRIAQVGFLLALSLFLIMASLMIYMRVMRPDSNVQNSQAAHTLMRNSGASGALFRPTAASVGNSWRILPSMPSTEADNTAVYVEVQGRTYIYMSGGYRDAKHTPHYDRNLYRYDIEAAHWETVPTSGMPGMVNNTAVLDEQGHIFFTAGYSTDAYATTSRLYVYQPADGTLHTIIPPAQMPIGFGGAMIADQHGHLYILQGFMAGGDPHALAGTGWYRYDIGNGQWHRLASLPVGLGYVVLAPDGNGGILLLGGAKDAGQHLQISSIYRYDIAHDSWTLEWNMLPQPLSGAASCQVRQDQFVILGGYDTAHGNGLNSVWLFNARTLQWKTLAELPFGGSVLGAAACDGAGHVYVVRGASNPMQPTRDFWELVVP